MEQLERTVGEKLPDGVIFDGHVLFSNTDSQICLNLKKNKKKLLVGFGFYVCFAFRLFIIFVFLWSHFSAFYMLGFFFHLFYAAFNALQTK